MTFQATSKQEFGQNSQSNGIFLDNSYISLKERAILDLYLKQSRFRGDIAKNIKIITVGIPAGFSSEFETRINVESNLGKKVVDKEKDVININIFRRSVDFEDLVFKPLSFLFETSRFVMRSSINNTVIPKTSFNEFLNSNFIAFMKDFAAEKQDQSMRDFLSNSRYNFLNETQKISMITNHIESYVLGLYLRLMTGVSTDENDYYFSDLFVDGIINDEAQKDFINLLELYLEGFTKKKISLSELIKSSPELKSLLSKFNEFSSINSVPRLTNVPRLSLTGVSSSQRVKLTEDLKTFIDLYNPKTFITGGKIERYRILASKTFERIFNVAVDPDDFIIDESSTRKTASGIKMLNLLEQRQLVFRQNNDLKLVPLERDKNMFLDQYMTNISTVADIEVE